MMKNKIDSDNKFNISSTDVIVILFILFGFLISLVSIVSDHEKESLKINVSNQKMIFKLDSIKLEILKIKDI